MYICMYVFSVWAAEINCRILGKFVPRRQPIDVFLVNNNQLTEVRTSVTEATPKTLTLPSSVQVW